MRRATKGITRAKIHKLWSFIGFNAWLDLLKEHKPKNSFYPAGQEVLKGLCIHPDHQDTDPSFYIYTERGFAKCFGGSCRYYDSNPIQVLAHIRGCSYAESLQYIQETFKPPFIPKQAAKLLEDQRRNQWMKQEILKSTHDLMIEAIARPTDPNYSYATTTLNWLINLRGIPQNVLHALPIGIMPELQKLVQDVSGRYKRYYKAWQAKNSPPGAEPPKINEAVVEYLADTSHSVNFPGSIVFPLHVTPQEIGRFKIRSPENNDGGKNFLIPADDFEDMLGLFGLGWDMYKPFFGKGSDSGFIYVGEGEMDALSVMAKYAETGHVKFPLVSAGGRSACSNIEPILESAGITEAYYVGDAPHKDGPGVVKDWLEQTSRLKTSVFTGWDKFPGAGDIDDAMKLHGLDSAVQIFFTDSDANFTNTWAWAFGNAAEVLDTVAPEDFRKRMDVAAEHGKYLKNRIDLEHYVEQISAAYDLNPSHLKREIISRDHTEQGFVQSCGDALKQLMYVVGTQMVNHLRYLVVFDRDNYDNQKRYFRTIKLDSEQSINQELAPICGSIIRFVEEHVGRPPFLEFPDPSNIEKLVHPKLTKQLSRYLSTALIDITQGVPELERAQKRSQGYHCIETKDGQPQEFIVCGTDIIHFNREGNGLTYRKLEGPSYEDIFFDVGLTESTKGESWYPGGLAIADLERAQKNANLVKLYDDIVSFYDLGFKFKNQKITSQLLAALIMCFPIMSAFSHPTLMFVTGDTSSGKTSLLSTFTPLGFPGIRLLHSSRGNESYTAAGIARLIDGDSLLLALDEFESGDTERGVHVQRIFEMLRPIITGEATRIMASGSGTLSQYFSLPIIFSAIQGAERPQDLNRLLIIEMQKTFGKIDPRVLITDEIGPGRLASMRTELNLGMFPHALELARHEQEIQESFISLQNETTVKIEWRLASILFAPLAMMKFLGKDWRQFFKDYVREHEYTITRVSTSSETDSYLNAVLYNSVISQPDGPPCSLAKLLVSNESREEINTANKGVYFDAEHKALLFLVDQISNLLPVHLRGKMASIQMKNLLERHSSALSPEEIDRSKILHRVGRYLGAGIRLQDVVVLNAERWLGETQRAQEGTPDIVSEKPEEDEKGKDDDAAEDTKDAADFNWGGDDD